MPLSRFRRRGGGVISIVTLLHPNGEDTEYATSTVFSMLSSDSFKLVVYTVRNDRTAGVRKNQRIKKTMRWSLRKKE